MKNFIGRNFRKIPASPFSDDYSKIYRDLIDFGVGDPDIETDKGIIESIYKAGLNGQTHYTDPRGTLEFRKAYVDFYKEEYHIDINEKNVLSTMSGTEALYIIFKGIIDEGDEVIIPSPFFSPYADQLKICGGKAKFLETYIENEYEFTISDLEKLVSDRTKAILINTPNNPTGAVYSKHFLEEIYNFCLEKNILIICDDIYDNYTYYDDFYPSLKFDKNLENVITINSLSKDFVMTGLRLGAIIANEKLIDVFEYIHENILYCIPSLTQVAQVYALKNRKQICPPLKDEYKKRMKLAYKRLKELKNVEVIEPKGAFYLFPKINSNKYSMKEIVDKILKEAHIRVINGKAFGPGGENHIRIAVTVKEEKINEAFDRLSKLDIFNWSVINIIKFFKYIYFYIF